MRFDLPKCFFVVLMLLVTGAVFLPGGVVRAEDSDNGGKDNGGEEDPAAEEPSDFWEDETTFSPKQVEVAIRKGVTWLKSAQQRSGTWGGIQASGTYGGGKSSKQMKESHLSGPTSLAIFTLLKCKQELKDPVIKRGFDFLKKHKKPSGSYERSMMLLALSATADKFKTSKGSKAAGELGRIKLKGKYRGWATKLVEALVDGRTARGWRYNYDGQSTPGGPEDVSSTQLAALALFAAHRAGIKVKPKVWEDIYQYSMEQQEADGPEVEYPDPVTKDPNKTRTARARGFAYILGQEDPDEGNATGAMTACALANIEMARFVLSDAGSEKGREKWNARPDAKKVQESIFDGLAWLEKNWSAFDNPKKQRLHVYHVYWLYAVERAMDLFSLKLVGSHRWYNEMGQELLNRQHEEGFWDSNSTHGPRKVIDTCFALLFLKRSTKDAIPYGSVTGGGGSPIDSR